MAINESSKGNRRFFSIVSLGKARWYWIVWPSLHELQTSPILHSHVAEGYEKTKADAVEKALETAGRHAEWIAAKYAKAYHHNTRADTARKGNKPPTPGTPNTLAMQEFLFRDILDDATKQWNPVPHRVVQRTNRYIYVEQQPYSPHDLTESWLDHERPTYRLDRQALEQNGYAFLPATADLAEEEEPLFFIDERKGQPRDEQPEYLTVLHLSWPCTAAEVQEAYRRLVKSAHPDGGGNHDTFLELQTAYEQAMRLCR